MLQKPLAKNWAQEYRRLNHNRKTCTVTVANNARTLIQTACCDQGYAHTQQTANSSLCLYNRILALLGSVLQEYGLTLWLKHADTCAEQMLVERLFKTLRQSDAFLCLSRVLCYVNCTPSCVSIARWLSSKTKKITHVSAQAQRQAKRFA